MSSEGEKTVALDIGCQSPQILINFSLAKGSLSLHFLFCFLVLCVFPSLVVMRTKRSVWESVSESFVVCALWPLSVEPRKLPNKTVHGS